MFIRKVFGAEFMSRRIILSLLNRSSVCTTIAGKRGKGIQKWSERFEQHRLAVHQRQVARHQRYFNAFKRTGSAFRLWWLMLLGVMAKHQGNPAWQSIVKNNAHSWLEEQFVAGAF